MAGKFACYLPGHELGPAGGVYDPVGAAGGQGILDLGFCCPVLLGVGEFWQYDFMNKVLRGPYQRMTYLYSSSASVPAPSELSNCH